MQQEWLLSDQEGQSYYVPMYPFTRVKLLWAICSCTTIYFPYLSSLLQHWWRSLNTWHVLAGFPFVVSSLGHELSLHLQERRKRCWNKWNTRNNWTITETLPLKHSQQERRNRCWSKRTLYLYLHVHLYNTTTLNMCCKFQKFSFPWYDHTDLCGAKYTNLLKVFMCKFCPNVCSGYIM